MTKLMILKSGIIIIFFFIIPKNLISQNFKTISYLPTYRFDKIDEIDLSKLTHLNISFANPDENGILKTNGNNIKPIIIKAHDKDLQVFIALAGAGAKLSDWAPWLKVENRSAFIHNIINYVKQNNLQGIDVDLEWENINNDYSGFVLELKDSTKFHNLKLSAALPGTHRYPQISDKALKAFDWINIMAYDLTGPWAPNNPGPHSPYSFTEQSINYWIGQGLEKHKIVIGVPFYGYDFTDQNNVQSVKYSEMVSRDVSYAQLDKVGQIYYNGLPTIESKTELAINKTAGVMIWEVGQDNFQEFSLLKKINETITKITSTKSNEINQNYLTILSPNPIRDHVKFELNEPQNIKVILFSNYQKILKSQTFSSRSNISFNTRFYPSGVYFLFIQGENFTKIIKLVKI